MDETLKLILRAHEGDKTARDQLVMDNVGLIWSIVRRFAGRGYEMEDLFQIGSIGLMKAIDKFDTTFEVKFSTYAVPMITGGDQALSPGRRHDQGQPLHQGAGVKGKMREGGNDL